MMRIPFVDLRSQHQPIRDEVLRALAEAVDKDFENRPNVRAFEAEFATYCGVRYAIGIKTETDAMVLALRACGIRPGDEVITVAYNGSGAVEAIIALGAEPVFVDVDPGTYTLDPTRLAAALGRRTRAIVPAHLYGQMADMAAITDFARRHGLVVIEDASHAPGAQADDRRAGAIGDAGVFGFDPWKNLGSYCDGGMVTTNSRAVAQRIRQLRDREDGAPGFDRRIGSAALDELEAAVLRIKLRYLDAWNERRRQHAELYRQLLEGADVVVPLTRSGVRHVFHLYVVQIADRDRVRELLSGRGIETGVHYAIPVPAQQDIAGVGRIAGDLLVTEQLARRVLSLPMHAELSAETIGEVARSLREALGLLSATGWGNSS